MKNKLSSLLNDLPLLLRRIKQPNLERGYYPQRALLIVAHPDDPEYFCAGTIARWARSGAEVCYIICTSGQLGTKNSNTDPYEIARIREGEQIAAARLTGVKDVVFLRHQDGLLEDTITLRHQLVREIRRFRPEVVVINDPRIYFGEDFINHPDHRAAAEAALGAVYPLAGSPLIFRELENDGFQAHTVRKLYIFTWNQPNTWVDITDSIDIKIAALKLHHSQMGDSDLSDSIRHAASRSAKFLRMKYAEPFRVLQMISDDDWSDLTDRA